MDKIPFVIQLHGIPGGVLPGFLLPSYHSRHPGTQRWHQYAFCVFEIYLYTNRGVLASLHNHTSNEDKGTPWLHEQTIAHLSSTWKIILNIQKWHFLIYFLHKHISFPLALSECVFVFSGFPGVSPPNRLPTYLTNKILHSSNLKDQDLHGKIPRGQKNIDANLEELSTKNMKRTLKKMHLNLFCRIFKSLCQNIMLGEDLNFN